MAAQGKNSRSGTGNGPVPVDAVARMRLYSVPRPRVPIEMELDSNEGEPPPLSLSAALGDAFPAAAGRYPRNAGPLAARIAGTYGVDPSRVIVTQGGDEVIDRLCRAYLCPGRRVVIPEPTFEMFEYFSKLAGAEICKVERRGSLNEAQIVKAAGTQSSVVCIASPNNPDGAVTGADVFGRLSAALPSSVILADLAYVEFADEDPTAGLIKLPNVVVLRSFSKAWSLAGMRVGWGIGPEEIVSALKLAGAPYHNPFTSALASIRMESAEGDVRSFIHRVRTERSVLEELMGDLGARTGRSQGNFVFATFTTDETAQWVRLALGSLGIGIRGFPGRPGLSASVRITCKGDPAIYAALKSGLIAALAPESVMFDGSAPGAVTAWAAAEGVKAGVYRRGSGGGRWVVTAHAKTAIDARHEGGIPIGWAEGGHGEEALWDAGAAAVIKTPEKLVEMAGWTKTLMK